MQRYGMILADAGQIALTAQSDRFTTAKWNSLLGPHDLVGIEVTDFEVVNGGERFSWTGDCVRAPEAPENLRVVKTSQD
jgi:serine/threonine-protein kinase